MRGAATKAMSDIVEERQQSRYAPLPPRPCGPQARWLCCSLLTYRPGYSSSLAPRQRAWGPAAKCKFISARALRERSEPQRHMGRRRDSVSINMLLRDLAQELIDSDQCGVHDLFAGAHRRWRHPVVGAVAPFRNCLNRWEVLVVPVAIAEKEKLPDPCPLFQSERMAAEELAGKVNQSDISVQQSHGKES